MQKMIGKMARMYPLLILMGFMMVGIAFVIGYFNSQTAAAYFAEAKAVRETALLAERATFESVGLWLPYFKFLGLGFILGGIVMALRVIIENLQSAGNQVLANLPEGKRPGMPKPPWYGPLMPMVMMLGVVVFIVALIVSIGLANSANQLYANPIPAIEAAGAGSSLLTDLQRIKSTAAWLVPLKFFGVATEFLAITMGLSTIIYILSSQTDLIAKGIDIARAGQAKANERERVPA
jgi:hypothetical protein